MDLLNIEPIECLEFDRRIKLPVHALFAGATMSGKTRLAIQLLSNPDNFVEPPKLIIIYYAEMQQLYNDLKDKLTKYGIEVRLKRGHTVTLDEFQHSPSQTVIIIDDAFEETAASAEIVRLTTTGRHRNISVWLCWQALFSRHANSRIISQNMGLYFFLPSPRLESQLRTFGAQLGMQQRLMAAYKRCINDEPEKSDYPHILVDLSPNVPHILRVRSHVHQPVQYCYG